MLTILRYPRIILFKGVFILNTRDIFTRNLNVYIKRSGKNKKIISEEMGIPYTTLVDWANGNKFPRADGIERLSNYFDILKSELLEEQQNEQIPQNINIVKLAGRDGSYVEKKLTDDQLDLIKKMIDQMPDAEDL